MTRAAPQGKPVADRRHARPFTPTASWMSWPVRYSVACGCSCVTKSFRNGRPRACRSTPSEPHGGPMGDPALNVTYKVTIDAFMPLGVWTKIDGLSFEFSV